MMRRWGGGGRGEEGRGYYFGAPLMNIMNTLRVEFLKKCFFSNPLQIWEYHTLVAMADSLGVGLP